MGLLNFMNKNKNTQSIPEPPSSDIDMPPAPPGMDMSHDVDFSIPPPIPDITLEDSKDLPDFPEIKGDESFEPYTPGLPSEQEVIEKVNNVKEQVPEKPKIPDFKSFRMPTMQPPQQDTFFDNDQEEEMPEEPVEQTRAQPTYMPHGPLFINSEHFQRILGRIKSTKLVIKDIENRSFKLNELKNKEEKKFEQWKSKLEDIQRKLIYVDKVLFEKI